MENLINWYYQNKNRFSNPKTLNSNEYKEILNITSFLNEHYISIIPKQRIWHLENNCFELQRCKICGNVTRYERHIEYCSTCSDECSKEYRKYGDWKEKHKQTCLKNLGVDNPSKSKKTLDKIKAVMIKNYGVDNYSKTDECKEKSKLTCLDKYGVDNYSKTDEFKEKSKLTCLDKYGVENYSQTDEFKEKSKSTSMERYGVEYYNQTEECKEKSKLTCLDKYGVEHYQYTEELKKRLKNTSMEKFGKEYYSKTNEFKEIFKKNYSEKLKQRLVEDNYIGYEIKEFINDGRYTLICPKCNKEFEITSNLYYQRAKLNHEICSCCNPLIKSYSSIEKYLVDYIKSIYSGKILENSREIIKPKELDIYIPDLNLAIEFNGLIWHSDKFIEDKYHKIKSELCEIQGLRLIHIFEDDWLYKTDICKSILQTAINPQLNQKIFARKCEIKETNLDDTNKFLEKNHINGRIMTQTIGYGLYYNSELISLMSFKGNILQRYAIKLNITIIGGAEKLFKKANLQNCITYCDISLFSGKIYERLGFKFVRRNKPNFMFIKKESKQVFRVSKQSIRKLKQGYKRENDTMPRIYNCGIDVYEYK